MPTTLLRFVLPLLLLGLLGSCATYDRMMHPHRLGSTRMPADMEAQYKAKEKARHKGLTYKAPEESTGATDAGAKGKTDEKKPLTYKDLSEGTKNKYDKQGLIRDHLPAPTPRHTYETHVLKGTKVGREARKLQKRKKGKDQEPSPGKDAGKEESTAPAQDAPEPAPQPEAAPAPKGN